MKHSLLLFSFSLISALFLTSADIQWEVPKTNSKQSPFIGTWRLDHVTMPDANGDPQVADLFTDGLIMYSADGYMSAILHTTAAFAQAPNQDVGYCGKYIIHEKDGYVEHLRDVITINNDEEHEVFKRNFAFSDKNNQLVLTPHEAQFSGLALTWKRVGTD